MKTDTEDTVRVTVTLNRMSDPEWYELIKSIKNGRTRADVLRRHLRLPTISIASPAKPSASKLPAQQSPIDQLNTAAQVGQIGGSVEPSGSVVIEKGSENTVSKSASKLTPEGFLNQAEVNSLRKDAAGTDTNAQNIRDRNLAPDPLQDGDKAVDSQSVIKPASKETGGVKYPVSTETRGDDKPVVDQPKKNGMAASMLANGNTWNSGT